MSSFGQIDPNIDYIPIQCEGPIPIAVRALASKKFKQDKEIYKGESRKKRKQTDRFLLKSNFILDEMLISGQLLFGDPVTQYINKVADVLLKDAPGLRKQIDIYTTKSTALNAFSTDKGILVFNLGLIARAENEAQIAFILAHELSHYIKKHNIDKYFQVIDVLQKKEKYLESQLGGKLLEISMYSKDKEYEADKIGFEKFFGKSKYSLDEIESSFDLLKKSHLPFGNTVIDSSFFGFGCLLDSNHFLKHIASIDSLVSDENDTSSTHPSTDKRKEVILDLAKEYNNDNRSIFINSKEEFSKVRELARFELSRQYYTNGLFAHAIYNSYLLLQDHPTSEYLKVNIAASFYAITKYNRKRSSNYTSKFLENVDGESKQLFHVLSKLNIEELAVACLLNISKTKEEYPKNEYLGTIYDEALNILVEIHTEDSVYYSSSLIKGGIKILKTRKGFVVDWNLAVKEYIEKENAIQAVTRDDLKRKRKEKKVLKKYYKRHGYSLGIDEISIINPTYEKADQRKKDQVRHLEAEEKEIELLANIEEHTKSLGLNAKLLAPKIMKENAVNSFNEYANCLDWIRERLLSEDDLNLVPYNNQFLKTALPEHIVVLGFVTVRIKKTNIINKYGLFILGYVTIPIGVYLMVRPEYFSLFYYTIFNTKDASIKMNRTKFWRRSAKNGGYLNKTLYDSLLQTKRK